MKQRYVKLSAYCLVCNKYCFSPSSLRGSQNNFEGILGKFPSGACYPKIVTFFFMGKLMGLISCDVMTFSPAQSWQE